jgi:hypothetical protein
MVSLGPHLGYANEVTPSKPLCSFRMGAGYVMIKELEL